MSPLVKFNIGHYYNLPVGFKLLMRNVMLLNSINLI